jgi:hypothetical protein
VAERGCLLRGPRQYTASVVAARGEGGAVGEGEDVPDPLPKSTMRAPGRSAPDALSTARKLSTYTHASVSRSHATPRSLFNDHQTAWVPCSTTPVTNAEFREGSVISKYVPTLL